jgi:hypothetical protein
MQMAFPLFVTCSCRVMLFCFIRSVVFNLSQHSITQISLAWVVCMINYLLIGNEAEGEGSS